MKPTMTVLSVATAFSVGMLVPLVGLHATRDFRHLEYFGDMLANGDQHRPASERDRSAPVAGERATAERMVVAAWQDALVRDVTPVPDDGERLTDTSVAVDAAAPAAMPPEKAADDVGRPAGQMATAARGSVPHDVAVTAPAAADVAEIQVLLAVHGFFVGAIDGIAGPQTRAAIRAYQRSAGLAVTGEPSAALLAALSQGDTPASPRVKDRAPTVAAAVASAPNAAPPRRTPERTGIVVLAETQPSAERHAATPVSLRPPD